MDRTIVTSSWLAFPSPVEIRSHRSQNLTAVSNASLRGEPVEEMSDRSWELVASDEPTILAKPLFDAVVMRNGQSDGWLANPASTNESNWCKIFGETAIDGSGSELVNKLRHGLATSLPL